MKTQLVLGDPTEAGVTVGPLINQSQHSKVCSMVESAVNAGATLVTGTIIHPNQGSTSH